MAEALLVEGGQAIAAVCGRPLATLREQMATYPDPLPVWRLRGGRTWARRDRLLSWCARHPVDSRGFPARDVQHPLPGLAVVRGRVHMGRVVRLLPRRLARLLPWAATSGNDPVPAYPSADGTIWAYRDALLDWLDRQSERARRPRFRRRWATNLVSERKRRGRTERKVVPKTASARRETQAARVPLDCQEGSKGAAQKARAAA